MGHGAGASTHRAWNSPGIVRGRLLSRPILRSISLRIILYTGKGGVGKTSISAATAIRCAALGYRTLVMSTDAAHSLSDSLEVELGDEPTPVAKDLFGLEIDVEQELQKNWGRIQSFIKRNLIRTAGFNDLIAEEFAVFPGMEELFSLLKLKAYYEAEAFDVAIVDCAPTAGTIRLLSFPDIAQWYMEKVFHVERRIMKLVRPVVNPMIDLELPSDDIYGSVEELYKRLDGMKDILSEESTSSIRLVMNPEKMVIRESQRAYAYLCLFGFPVDAAVVNRIYPQDAGGSYLERWREIQGEYLKEVADAFSPLPMLRSHFREDEVVGQQHLTAMAEDLFGDDDPTQIYREEQPLRISGDDGHYEVSLYLPFTTKDDVDVWIHGDELVIRIRNFKRHILLPRSLATRDIGEAKLDNGRLRVQFANKDEGD